MRLQVKLKKSKSNKYRLRYTLTIDKIYLPRINGVEVFNLKQLDEKLVFDCNSHNFKLFKKLNIPYIITDNYKSYLNHNINKKVICLIIILSTLFLFLINQFMIREIVFSDERFETKEVYDYVIDNTKRIGPYYILSDSIVNVSKELRNKFYQYAYIGLSKKGSKLTIEIVCQDVHEKEETGEKLIGEFISKQDAYITKIKLSSGIVLVNTNMVVKKGEVLVTSNTQYESNLYDLSKCIELNGYIIGKVKEYFEVEIPKEYSYYRPSGTIEELYDIKFLEKSFFNKNTKFENSFLKSKILLNFKGLVIKKEYHYEKELIKEKLSIDEAYNFAMMKYYQKFEEERTTKEEKIVSTNVVETHELTSSFKFKFIIVSYKNICEYKKF